MYILILEVFPKEKMMVAVRPQDCCQVQGHLGLKSFQSLPSMSSHWRSSVLPQIKRYFILATKLPMLLKCSLSFLLELRKQTLACPSLTPEAKGHHRLDRQIPLPPGSQYKGPQLL